MQFHIDTYCHRLKEALYSTFGPRLCYPGLQGSWLRGEDKTLLQTAMEPARDFSPLVRRCQTKLLRL